MRSGHLITNLFVGLLIIVGGVSGFVILSQPPEAERQPESNEDPGVPVRVAEVRDYRQPLSIAVDGEASTYRIVTVGAEVAGRLVKKSDGARTGMYVQRDTPLFEIDSTDFDLAVRRLEAQRNRIREDINGLDVDLENTQQLAQLAEENLALQKARLDRSTSALRRGALSQGEIDDNRKQELDARNQLQTLRNQLRSIGQQKASLTAELQLREVELEEARADLARTIVKAPINGRIADDLVEEGAYVRVGDDLVHITDSDRMEIRCNLQSDDLAWIWKTWPDAGNPDEQRFIPDIPCTVVFEFEGVETSWDGVLNRFEGTGIDTATRTIPCRVVVDDPRSPTTLNSVPGRELPPLPGLISGMYVSVRIPIPIKQPMMQIPVEAVRPGGEIWVVTENGLSIRRANVARMLDETALLFPGDAGLQPGDKVIVSPMAAVREGMPLNLNVPADSEPAAVAGDESVAPQG